MNKRMVVLAVVIILVSFPVSHLWAQGNQERQSLSGLPGVAVIVGPIHADAERDGLTADALKTDVELWLRQAGITVFSQPGDDFAGPAFPYLTVVVSTVKSGDSYALCKSVQMFQVVTSRVTGDGAIGSTWQASEVSIVSSALLRDIRDDVKGIVDEFINDWLAVHPQ